MYFLRRWCRASSRNCWVCRWLSSWRVWASRCRATCRWLKGIRIFQRRLVGLLWWQCSRGRWLCALGEMWRTPWMRRGRLGGSLAGCSRRLLWLGLRSGFSRRCRGILRRRSCSGPSGMDRTLWKLELVRLN